MKNVTISLDENLINVSREYAKRNNTSLNALIEKLLSKTVLKDPQQLIDEVFQLADKLNVKSENGVDWRRDELYDR